MESDLKIIKYSLKLNRSDLDYSFLRGIIFDHKFAEFVGYKLENLGRWCDEGKNPLDFLKGLLNNLDKE